MREDKRLRAASITGTQFTPLAWARMASGSISVRIGM
jgi:hypothetical protein